MAEIKVRARLCFVGAALGLLSGAVLHLVVLAAGPKWIAFVGAPESVVESAERGTWLAPFSTVGIAAFLVIFGAYALAGAGVIRRLPLTRTMLVFVSVVFIVRGIIIVPLLLAGRVNWSALPDLFVVGSSVFILAVGVLTGAGLTALSRQPKAKLPTN